MAAVVAVAAVGLASLIFGKKKRRCYVPDPEANAARDAAFAEAAANNERTNAAAASASATQAETNRAHANFAAGEKAYEEKLKKEDIERQKKDEAINEAFAELKNIRINNLDELDEKDKTRVERVFDVCATIEPASLEGVHVGTIGKTSCGKSSWINAAIGDNICEVGRGETTTEPAPYNMPSPSVVTLWDLPGNNDELTYFNATYVALLKAMSFIGLMMVKTVKEVTQMAGFCERLGLDYYVIVNKIDDVPADKVDEFKRRIHADVASLLGTRCKDVFFISAKKARRGEFDLNGEWFRLMDTITSLDHPTTGWSAADAAEPSATGGDEAEAYAGADESCS